MGLDGRILRLEHELHIGTVGLGAAERLIITHLASPSDVLVLSLPNVLLDIMSSIYKIIPDVINHSWLEWIEETNEIGLSISLRFIKMLLQMLTLLLQLLFLDPTFQCRGK